MIVYLDGRFLPEEEATISIEDRGFLLGDGVFETALLYNGGFLRLRQHLERLQGSAAILRLSMPPLADVDGIVRALARENDLRDASIRITLSRGASRPVLLVTARPADQAWARRAPAAWRVITARTRRPSIASIPPQLKALGRTYALLARFEAADAGVDDALLLNEHGHVCEGPTWNVFWRTGNALFTPALAAGVLAGVTRTLLLDIAPAVGLSVHEVLAERAILEGAAELFATMTSAGIVSIRELDGRTLRPRTRAAEALRPLYLERVTREAAADPL